MQLDILLWIMPAGAAVYLLLGVITLVTREREARGGAHWLMLVLALWILGGLLEMVSGTRDLAFAGIQLSFASAALVPALGLITVRHITGEPLSQGARVLVLLIPAGTIMLLMMQPYNDLIWSGTYSSPTASVPESMNYGAWFNYVHAPYSFGICFLALGILLVDSLRRDTRRRWHVLAFSTTALVPIVGCLLHLNGVDLYFSAPTTVLTALVSPIIAWLMLRHGVLLEAPVQHKVLFEQMSDGIVVLDASHRILAINEAGQRLLELRDADAVGKKIHKALPHIPELSQPLENLYSEHEVELSMRHLAFRLVRVNGEDKSGQNDLLICRDVTSERTARRELVRSEEMLRSLVHNSSNAILRLRRPEANDGSGEFTIIVANPVAADMLFATPDEIIGRSIVEVVNAAGGDESKRSLHSILPAIREAAASGETTEREFRQRLTSGERWYRLLADPVDDDIGIICVDVTRQRQQEIELESAAFIDPLTGVMNRRGFERRASACLAEQDDDAIGALLFVDLDNFKRVNDIHGHDTGDQVLQMVADRLLGVLRDIDIVARLGGDEFVVLAPQTKASAAGRLRDRLETALAEPYIVAGIELNSAASVGVALFPDQGVTLTSLMRSADASMYERKTRSRTTISGSYRIVSVKE